MHQRIDAFELWCWRRLLRVAWTARRSKQSILKEISPEYSLEGLMLKLKLQSLATWCEELTHWKRPWWWERLKAGGEGDVTGWDDWMASLTQWTWAWVSSGSWWWTGRLGVLQSMGSQRIRHNWVAELNWTDSYGILSSSRIATVCSQQTVGTEGFQETERRKAQVLLWSRSRTLSLLLSLLF